VRVPQPSQTGMPFPPIQTGPGGKGWHGERKRAIP
jgi:hypothetical protein